MHFANLAFNCIPENEIGIIGDVKGVLDQVLAILCFEDNDTQNVIASRSLTLNCHAIVRFIVRHVSGLRVVDGWYHSTRPKEDQPEMSKVYYCAHSWLITDSGRTIIDPYPVDLVAAGTVIAIPTCVPPQYMDTPYFGAGKYEEGSIDGDLYDPLETLKTVLKFEMTLKSIAQRMV